MENVAAEIFRAAEFVAELASDGRALASSKGECRRDAFGKTIIVSALKDRRRAILQGPKGRQDGRSASDQKCGHQPVCEIGSLGTCNRCAAGGQVHMATSLQYEIGKNPILREH